MLQVLLNSLHLSCSHFLTLSWSIVSLPSQSQGIPGINALCVMNSLTSFRLQLKYHLLKKSSLKKKSLPCVNWNNTYPEEKGSALSPRDNGLKIYLLPPVSLEKYQIKINMEPQLLSDKIYYKNDLWLINCSRTGRLYMNHKHLLRSTSFSFPVLAGGKGKEYSGVNGNQDKN